jgi:phosphatidylinositol-3-phosphatase
MSGRTLVAGYSHLVGAEREHDASRTAIACCFAAVFGLLGLLVAGCSVPGPTAAGLASTGPASTAATALKPSPRSAQPAAGGPVRKIFVIMEENHSDSQVFPAAMPYLWSLANAYSWASAYRDVGHPSLPNYLAVFAGSAFNDPADCLPGPGCTFPGPTVFGQVLGSGGTARAYQESMTQPCQHANAGEYDVNHNPWVYFPSEAAQCAADDVPAGTPAAGALTRDVRAGTLPNVGLLTPNLIHDGHDGSLGAADSWLREWVPALLAGPDWRSEHLAVVVVFDEGETTDEVPMVVIAPGVSGVNLTGSLNHFALTRLIDEVAGVPDLRQAGLAANVAGALHLLT